MQMIQQRWLLAPVVAIVALAGAAAAAVAAEAKLELKKGDHVAILGNTLADRMQHDGWLEAHLQARLPQHELVIRNLGFSGDELDHRIRSADFGRPEEWLKRTKADVVFAFFGYNESFAGEAGLDKFREDLGKLITDAAGKNFGGRGEARLVLFSPIAHENLKDRNLPDGSANNKNLKLYADAMAAVAKDKGVAFVDLFTPTQAAYEKAEKPLTINGVHLNDAGNAVLAGIIADALLGQPTGAGAPDLEKIRAAVLDKNFHWFNRYRTTDGFSIYGGRAGLKFTDGQTNKVVMDREMEVLDVMTANRDKVIWAAAQGKDLKPDDGNTPEFVPVVSNKPGPGPDGAHVFLGGADAIKRMKVAPNMKVSLFADERMFPGLINPVQMSFDPQGRLWVATWPTYPHWKPKTEMNDRLLVLEDTDGDGKADKSTTFAGDLHNPTGFEFYNGGVIVAMVPDILFLKDTDGDGKADVREHPQRPRLGRHAPLGQQLRVRPGRRGSTSRKGRSTTRRSSRPTARPST